MPKSTVFLGFDFGMRRIGVATGQSITGSASPLITLKSNGGKPDWQQIRKLIAEWGASELVVGVPYPLKDSEKPITDLALAFAENLRRETGLSVHTVDEALTTVEARAEIHAHQGHVKRKAFEPVDDCSAALILEAFFASKNN